MPLFRVSGLSKQFGKLAALADVRFEVREGEILGLIGPNGAGKSTLFECLAGVMPYDSGSIVDANDKPIDPGKALFYVPDAIAPWPGQSVSWMLEFVVGFYVGRAGLRSEIVAQMDLGAILNQPIGTLSKGQRKRALIAAGLLTPQPALLIDEPFDGLDLRQMRAIAAALRSHASRGRTLFLSIHQIGDAARFCDRFVLLNAGRIRGDGTIPQLAKLAGSPAEQNLEEVFLALT